MKDVLSLARPELRNIKPYSSARDEFQGEADIYLDANENPFGFRYKGVPGLNRYPDPLQWELKRALSERTGIAAGSIFAGNGSDEIIDLMIRAFCTPGVDSIIITPPTYGMYEVQARIHNVKVVEVPLREGFLPDEEGIAAAGAVPRGGSGASVGSGGSVSSEGSPVPVGSEGSQVPVGYPGPGDSAGFSGRAKLLFLCSPNNPTGNLIPTEMIARIASGFGGIVIVDEAYIDFSGTNGSLPLLAEYNNLLVMRTFSKARGMAAARLGLGFSNHEIISLLNKIKLPYNVNSLTLDAGLRSLESEAATQQQISVIISERERLRTELEQMPGIKKVWPSHANFLLVKVDNPRGLYNFLLSRGIVVRDRSAVRGCEGCLRFTVGRPPENEALTAAMQEFLSGRWVTSGPEGRRSVVRRRTGETDIYVRFNPAGSGIGDIQTGVGFLDHMLELFAFHSGSNLLIRGNGDLQVDPHHVAEDVALALGAAVADVVRQLPVERYGFTLPMDESLATVAIDMGGRAVLVWDVNLKANTIGDLPAEMVKHFFFSFSSAARCSINVQATGENDHHMVEAIFKAFGRALRSALKLSGDSHLPSSKGVM